MPRYNFLKIKNIDIFTGKKDNFFLIGKKIRASSILVTKRWDKYWQQDKVYVDVGKKFHKPRYHRW